jgi:hypothetical protein
MPPLSGIQYSSLLPPVKAEKPANVTQVVTFSRRAQYCVNTEGMVEDRSLQRAGTRGRPPPCLLIKNLYYRKPHTLLTQLIL